MSAPRPRRTKVAATPTLPPTPLLTIRVDGKPISVNSMYRSRGRGGRYLSAEAKEWETDVWAAALIDTFSYNTRRGTRPLTDYPALRVVCTFYRTRADADNLLKTTLDGLKLALRIDDRYFTSVEAHKSSDKSQRQGALIEVYAAA